MSEEAFLRSILEQPDNAASAWLILADWLEERGDPRFELVRLCHDRQFCPEWSPVERDDRVRQLLAAGMAPCVPAWANSLGMRFALIPAGTFLMGAPDSEEDRSEDEGPQHEVEITSPFSLGLHAVTQEQYKKVIGKNPSHFTRWFSSTANHPVEQVSWEDAVEFCRKLSDRPEEKAAGRTYRLPTEAEWEYACRGGTNSSSPSFFGDSLASTQANFNGIHPYGSAATGPDLQRTTPVGSYKPNAFGLYDMHGNVWEWCADWFNDYYYHQSPRQDPQGPQNGSRRVLRGGSWLKLGWMCRSASRGLCEPGNRDNDIGFRVLCYPRTA